MGQINEAPPVHDGDSQDMFSILAEGRRSGVTSHLVAIIDQLRRIRTTMRTLGYVLPELPPQLADLIEDKVAL